jgi:hypothetical protein
MVCGQLDAAYGYPNAVTKTLRALPLVSELPTDSSGRVYLAVDAQYCDYILPSQMLPELIGSGAIEEIDAGAYLQELPSPDLP